jgi:hypothetical protein
VITIDESSRSARAAAVARLLDELADAGQLRLPTLTADELAALGGLEARPLVDAESLDWWQGLSEDARRAVEASALRGLVARGLLAPGREGAEAGRVALTPAPELAILLAAQRGPNFVGVGVEVDRPVLRLFGVADEASGLRCVVSERVTGMLHDYVLWSPHHAPTALAAWACAPPQDSGQEAVRTLDLVTPGAGGPTRTRFSVMATATGGLLSEPDAGGTLRSPERTTADDLAARLRELM